MLTIFGVLCDLHGVLTRKTGQCFRPSRGLKSSPRTCPRPRNSSAEDGLLGSTHAWRGTLTPRSSHCGGKRQVVTGNTKT